MYFAVEKCCCALLSRLVLYSYISFRNLPLASKGIVGEEMTYRRERGLVCAVLVGALLASPSNAFGWNPLLVLRGLARDDNMFAGVGRISATGFGEAGLAGDSRRFPSCSTKVQAFFSFLSLRLFILCLPSY